MNTFFSLVMNREAEKTPLIVSPCKNVGKADITKFPYLILIYGEHKLYVKGPSNTQISYSFTVWEQSLF